MKELAGTPKAQVALVLFAEVDRVGGYQRSDAACLNAVTTALDMLGTLTATTARGTHTPVRVLRVETLQFALNNGLLDVTPKLGTRTPDSSVSISLGDPFADGIVARCREVYDLHAGRIPGMWLESLQMLVALVLCDKTHLKAMGYTPTEAARNVLNTMDSAPDDFDGWLSVVRAAVDRPVVTVDLDTPNPDDGTTADA